MEIRKLADLDLTDKKVFLRLDLNVPLKNGEITDETRLIAALPTIKYILEHTNKLCISSHLGRPKGKVVPEMSLEPIAHRLADILEREVVFCADYASEPPIQVLDQIDRDQFMVLENLRFHAGETKNDEDFSALLAKGFDIYVNDAFGAAHRKHSSTFGVAAKMPAENRAAGMLIQKEITSLADILSSPKAPFTVIVGGSKVSDKIGVILNLLEKCNNLLIGGAMAYTFLKFNGVDVGTSRVEEDKMDMIKSIYRTAEARNVKIFVPVDHLGASEFSADAPVVKIEQEMIPDGLMGLDIGPKTAQRYSEIIRSSQTVLWNGPMGVFEWPSYAAGSLAIANAMQQCSGQTVIGGGDSVAAVNMAGVGASMSHISTGGGAALELLEGKTLPGIKILEK
jgi:phosphoglycerate kinase